jgi:hypothetical protein
MTNPAPATTGIAVTSRPGSDAGPGTITCQPTGHLSHRPDTLITVRDE